MTKRIFYSFCFIVIALLVNAQITSAKITFERKTNLYKKFKHWDGVKDWIKEEDRVKIDYFEMFIADTVSTFKPVESDLHDEFEWATAKNSVYQNLNSGRIYLVKNMWGEEMHLTDSFISRKWQITENTRNIAGYICRKAIWKANDSTRIYAWFSYDLTPSTGPERFNGLPGTILGIATEDGGVVYFAKKVEILKPDPLLFIHPKRKKVYTTPELIAQLTKQYGHEKWFKRMLFNQFGVW